LDLRKSVRSHVNLAEVAGRDTVLEGSHESCGYLHLRGPNEKNLIAVKVCGKAVDKRSLRVPRGNT
jgi:hypothetical protein